MKTNMKGFIAVLSAAVALMACEKQEVMIFKPADCIYFKNPTTILATSFGYMNDDVESAIFTAEAFLAGSTADHDRQFSVEVVKEAGNSETRYEIVDPTVLKAGENVANVEIKVWKTANLATARDTIAIRLKPSETLIADMSENSTRYVTFYNKIEKPSWWTGLFISMQMGRYHDIKVKVLYWVLGSINDPRSNWVVNQQLLNNYCKINDIRYPDTGGRVLFSMGS